MPLLRILSFGTNEQKHLFFFSFFFFVESFRTSVKHSVSVKPSPVLSKGTEPDTVADPLNEGKIQIGQNGETNKGHCCSKRGLPLAGVGLFFPPDSRFLNEELASSEGAISLQLKRLLSNIHL